jgi:hypothetical protein
MVERLVNEVSGRLSSSCPGGHQVFCTWPRWNSSWRRGSAARSSYGPTRTSAGTSATTSRQPRARSMQPEDQARLRHLAEAATKAVAYSKDKHRADLDDDELLRLASSWVVSGVQPVRLRCRRG